MTMTNTAKPSSGTMANTARAASSETWASIATTWATETRTWADTGTFMSNIVKPLSVAASYSEANRTTSVTNLRSDSVNQVGQTFTSASTGNVYSAVAYLNKNGSPTGTITAKIYAMTGTLGLTSKPTGSALITSDAVNVADFSASISLVTFRFSTTNVYSLTSGTNYALVLDCSNVTGDASNAVEWGQDTTSPTHAGNKFTSTDNGANYTTSSSVDMCFYVYTVGSTMTNTAKPS
jgi:hypothetical protein